MAAGKLLVAEAGGVCRDMHDEPHHLTSTHILADNEGIHHEVVTLFSQVFRGEYPHPMPTIPL
jgi:myo-inositol-1(or 4)-monophosphatase